MHMAYEVPNELSSLYLRQLEWQSVLYAIRQARIHMRAMNCTMISLILYTISAWVRLHGNSWSINEIVIWGKHTSFGLALSPLASPSSAESPPSLPRQLHLNTSYAMNRIQTLVSFSPIAHDNLDLDFSRRAWWRDIVHRMIVPNYVYHARGHNAMAHFQRQSCFS